MPSIYAVGDVTGRAALTPIAIREGHAFADTVFGNKPWCVDHRLIATAVFSTPEIGVIGHNEDVARRCYGEIDVYKASFRPMKATLSGRNERVIMKVIVERASDRVVGVHVMGPDAGEIIQAVGIAVTMGATKADFRPHHRGASDPRRGIGHDAHAVRGQASGRRGLGEARTGPSQTR